MGSPIFAGRETGMDSASVNALRLAGASILGKTVTTEFAFMVTGPTTNPFRPGVARPEARPAGLRPPWAPAWCPRHWVTR